MDKHGKLYISEYNDCYGALLTPYQRQLITGYYDHDLSLGELAEEHGITPQGVRDALKRAEKSLEDFESKLGFVGRDRRIRKALVDIKGIGGDAERAADAALDILDS
ncbi:MAG: helix-turn-helix domain-containing protein [Clostridia bacterium]|nr:helix-turn-helix domain-containing protein [Clostridia bacterium]